MAGQLVGASLITGPFVSGRIGLQEETCIYETLGTGAVSVVAQLQRVLEGSSALPFLLELQEINDCELEADIE